MLRLAFLFSSFLLEILYYPIKILRQWYTLLILYSQSLLECYIILQFTAAVECFHFSATWTPGSLVRGSTCYVNYFPRCYNKMNFFPDTEYSVWCTTNSTLRGSDGIEFVVACCDHSDYCNRDLRPSFPTYESRGRSYFHFANHLGRGTINRS